MGASGGSQSFREYLQALPYDLLESVTEDYVWLSGLHFDSEERSAEFRRRRECCREECARRGVPNLYCHAAWVASPHAA
jgi:hypothetical protein